MKVIVTGGAGFVGSHAAEFYANQGHEVIVIDNLSRAKVLKKDIDVMHNWNYLSNLSNVKLIKGDTRDIGVLRNNFNDVDAVIHTAAQVAVTTAVENPREDFETNALGTFNVLEAARLSNTNPAIVFCSTNKVYGENVNNVGVIEGEKRYSFEEKYSAGIPETFSTDRCEHTPYGCSKLSADLYVQDYSHLYGLRGGVFRMSCIYGTRQLGVEDQGWVAWFALAALKGLPVTIYGDGKQVRDALFVTDLIQAYDRFIDSGIKAGVFNTGGGPKNTMSLIELMEILERETGKRLDKSYSGWRPSDQKVYISDISLLKEKLGWEPKVSPEDGVKKLVGWLKENV